MALRWKGNGKRYENRLQEDEMHCIIAFACCCCDLVARRIKERLQPENCKHFDGIHDCCDGTELYYRSGWADELGFRRDVCSRGLYSGVARNKTGALVMVWGTGCNCSGTDYWCGAWVSLSKTLRYLSSAYHDGVWRDYSSDIE